MQGCNGLFSNCCYFQTFACCIAPLRGDWTRVDLAKWLACLGELQSASCELMSARSWGTKISTLNSAAISSTCFTTGFYMARICPSLPVRRLSFMKLRQLLT